METKAQGSSFFPVRCVTRVRVLFYGCVHCGASERVPDDDSAAYVYALSVHASPPSPAGAQKGKTQSSPLCSPKAPWTVVLAVYNRCANNFCRVGELKGAMWRSVVGGSSHWQAGWKEERLGPRVVLNCAPYPGQ